VGKLVKKAESLCKSQEVPPTRQKKKRKTEPPLRLELFVSGRKGWGQPQPTHSTVHNPEKAKTINKNQLVSQEPLHNRSKRIRGGLGVKGPVELSRGGWHGYQKAKGLGEGGNRFASNRECH